MRKLVLLVAPVFVALLAMAAACGDEANDPSLPAECAALSECCASLAGTEAMTCAGALSGASGDDSACDGALNALHAGGTCSGTGSGTGSGSAAPPSAFITSTLGAQPSGSSTGMCNVEASGAPFYTVGTPSSSGIGTPVSNGASCTGDCTHPGTVVTVACQVAAAGASSYEVNVVVNQGEVQGITMGGTLTDTPGTPQGDFNVSFGSASGNYSESDCTVTLSTLASPAIAPGRIWASVSCPRMMDAEDNDVCAGTASFLIENCQE